MQRAFTKQVQTVFQVESCVFAQANLDSPIYVSPKVLLGKLSSLWCFVMAPG
jgi:hypothetical protein